MKNVTFWNIESYSLVKYVNTKNSNYLITILGEHPALWFWNPNTWIRGLVVVGELCSFASGSSSTQKWYFYTIDITHQNSWDLETLIRFWIRYIYLVNLFQKCFHEKSASWMTTLAGIEYKMRSIVKPVSRLDLVCGK